MRSEYLGVPHTYAPRYLVQYPQSFVLVVANYSCSWCIAVVVLAKNVNDSQRSIQGTYLPCCFLTVT